LKTVDLCLGLARAAKGSSAGQEGAADGCNGFESAHRFAVDHDFFNDSGLYRQLVVTKAVFWQGLLILSGLDLGETCDFYSAHF
jgi:hypothetical protein